MLLIESNTAGAKGPSVAPEEQTFSVRFLIRLMWLRRWTIIAFTAAAVLVALGYVLLRPAAYTANTTLLAYETKLAGNSEDAFFAEQKFDPATLETQIEILKSDKIALAVIDRLGLAGQTSDTGFMPNLFGALRDRIADWQAEILGPSRVAPAGAPGTREAVVPRVVEQEMLKQFKRNTAVERLGQSFILEVGFTAPDPELAARVANAITAAYLADQDAARAEAARSASGWIRDRIRELGPSARVISTALPPIDKSSIRGILLLAIATFAGAGLGIAAVFIWFLFRPRIYTPDQAEATAQAECLGFVPALPRRALRGSAKGAVAGSSGHAALLAHAVDDLGAPFAMAVQKIAVVIGTEAQQRGMRSIGITSATAGEGCSVIAHALARLMALSGSRVLLVESNPLGEDANADASAGLFDLLHSGGRDLDQVVREDHDTGMHSLALGSIDEGAYRPGFIWSQSMAAVLDEMRAAYDFVIFDLPPLSPTADTRAAAEFLDGLLLVIGWGRVTVDQLRHALRTSGSVRDKLFASVLNNPASPPPGFAAFASSRRRAAADKSSSLARPRDVRAGNRQAAPPPSETPAQARVARASGPGR